jgi:hypothetical protein
MNFAEQLRKGSVRKIPPDLERARSLRQASQDAVAALLLLPVTSTTTKTILREAYESLRQGYEAVGYEKGYKFESHDAITHFIADVLKDEQRARTFERYRVLRNKVNYAGKDIDIATAKRALRDIKREGRPTQP